MSLFSVRRLEEDDVETLNRDLSAWNGGEYARRSLAQRRQQMVQAIAYDRLGYGHAHGPFVASTVLEGEEGRFPVSAVLRYLTKPL